MSDGIPELRRHLVTNGSAAALETLRLLATDSVSTPGARPRGNRDGGKLTLAQLRLPMTTSLVGWGSHRLPLP